MKIVEDVKFEELFSQKNLRTTWNTIRKESRSHRVRDCLDYIDLAVTIDASLKKLREAILSGDYTPTPPSRYELAKSKGAFRLVTIPNLRDALVYRLISDNALERAIPEKVPGAYFSRRHKATPIGTTLNIEEDPYLSSFNIWFKYQEYRSQTLLSDIYNILVITDITNFFDSISHDLLLEYLSPLGLPRKAIGLLGRLLEMYKPPTGHSPNPKIGIPVDEFDCSRELAHIFLFEYDKKIVNEFGENNYVRWMDDQNIGAIDLTNARKIVNEVTRSLSFLRLTLNSGKTIFLDIDDVSIHFQLELNASLNAWQEKYKGKLHHHTIEAKTELEKIWGEFREGETWQIGNWDKILKRFYGLAVQVDASFLEKRVYNDLINLPFLDERLFLYLARRNKGKLLLENFIAFCENNESLYESTEGIFFDSCLLLNASSSLEKSIKKFASDFSTNKIKNQTGKPFGKSSALLCLYWFGMSGKAIYEIFKDIETQYLPISVVRTLLTIIAVRNPRYLNNIRAKLIGHSSEELARLSKFIDDLLCGNLKTIGNYRNQRSRWPLPGKYYDARTWLKFELISRGKNPDIKKIVKNDFKYFEKLAFTKQEKRILKRIAKRI